LPVERDLYNSLKVMSMSTGTRRITLVPIKRTDVFQTAVERIGQMIVENNMQPGERLPSEREIAESLGISRTTVRQALKVLESMGKVETRVGSGTYVANPARAESDPRLLVEHLTVDKTFMEKLIEARVGIERMVFESAFKALDDRALEELQQLLDENAREILAEEDEDGALDLSFEAKVAEIGGNEFIIGLQKQIHQTWIKAWRKYGYVPEKKAVLHEEHLKILDALKRRNRQETVDLIEQHVSKNVE